MSTASSEFLDSFEHLPENEKREVATEILRRTFNFDRAVQLDDARLAELYGEFADDDLNLAEEGMEDYNRGMLAEDAR
jgi:flagellar motor switch protein FliG